MSKAKLADLIYQTWEMEYTAYVERAQGWRSRDRRKRLLDNRNSRWAKGVIALHRREGDSGLDAVLTVVKARIDARKAQTMLDN